MIYNEQFSRMSSAPWFETVRKQNVLIAGLGGIGSNVAYSISRLGLKTLHIMDDDIVSRGNINGQFYSFQDENKSKVNALFESINKYSGMLPFKYNKKLDFNTTSVFINSTNIHTIITGFDNMVARKDAYMLFKNTVDSYPDKTFLYIDGRMNAEEFQIICLSSLSEDKYRFEKYEKEYLFDDKEAEHTICSFKQTSFVSQIIGGMITNLFVNFWYNADNFKNENFVPRSVPFITEYSADLMILNSKD